MEKKDQETLLEEVQAHLEDSNGYLETRREDFDTFEAMLIVQLTDSLSSKTSNKIFDPRLSTIVYERASRVMAQNPKGKAYANSKDDLGKNVLMNLLLKYFYKNANEQDSMLVKLRLLDVYSLVYGTMFGLVPWRVNQGGYIGPELNVLPIRDCFPQPSKRNVSDMDWFTVRNVVSIDWLKKQSKDVWLNIDVLEKDLKARKDEGDGKGQDNDGTKSFVEKHFYPSTYGDLAFPQVEIYTEYRKDKWITWTPQRVNAKTSKPYILRMTEDPYVNDMLPIVAKHAFPLIDSPIGLGEFARGASLQMGINSLWNLYMEGVKYSIFPPLHINPDNVVPTSIKWNQGEFWFMNNPNQDVQPMNMNPQGINTFQSTFGTLVAALETQAGTTSIRESAKSSSSLGKTPEAIRFISDKESARDEWDRVMMEQTIDQIYSRWVPLTVKKLEKKVKMRLFKEEVEDIQKTYPDVLELYESKTRGEVGVSKSDINDTYDFVLEVGSTTKVDIEEEQNNLTVILKAVLENPSIIEALRSKGQDIDLAELFKEWLVAGKNKNWDKIIIPLEQGPEQPSQAQLSPQDKQLMEQYNPSTQEVPMEQGAAPQDLQALASQFQDPAIQQAVLQTMSRSMGQVPPQA